MGRLEKYRKIRYERRKYISAFVLFFAMLITGMCVANNSVKGIIGEKNGIDILYFKNTGSFIEICFMNHKVYLDTTYLKDDFHWFKEELSQLLGIG